MNKQRFFTLFGISVLTIGYFVFNGKLAETDIYKKITSSEAIAKNPIPQNTLPPVAAQTQDLNRPKGEIVELIKSRDWDMLSKSFLDSLSKPSDIENKLSQIIYSLDSKLVLDDDHEKIVELLTILIEKPEGILPRGLILISKTIGKLNLSLTTKKSIEEAYSKNGWTKSQHWLDACIQWSPLPKSAIKKLDSLLEKNRNDLVSDYFYYANKIENKIFLKKIIKKAKEKIISFPKDEKIHINSQLKMLETKL